MPSKEHIGFSIFAHFQLNEYVIHFVYIQHCNGSFPSFSQRMDTICILWWHRILIEKSSNFNEHRTASCIFSFIQHSRNSVCFLNWFFVFMQSHSPIVWWVLSSDESGAVRSGSVRITYCKLHNLQSELLKQSWPIYRSKFNLCIPNYRHSSRSDAQLNFHVLIYLR